MTEYGVIVLPTSSAVMKAEKLLVKAGYAVKIIPVPREFSVDCGVSLRFDWEDRHAVSAALTRAGLSTDMIRRM